MFGACVVRCRVISASRCTGFHGCKSCMSWTDTTPVLTSPLQISWNVSELEKDRVQLKEAGFNLAGVMPSPLTTGLNLPMRLCEGLLHMETLYSVSTYIYVYYSWLICSPLWLVPVKYQLKNPNKIATFPLQVFTIFYTSLNRRLWAPSI